MGHEATWRTFKQIQAKVIQAFDDALEEGLDECAVCVDLTKELKIKGKDMTFDFQVTINGRPTSVR